MRLFTFAALASILALGHAGAQSLSAVAEAEHALTAANDRTPVAAAQATLVNAKAPLFGAYDRRPSNHYKAGETVLFYVEPVGLKHKAQGELTTCGLSMDLLLRRDGEVVFRKNAFMTADFPSRHAVQEIMLNGDLTVNAPAGEYVIELVLHDHNSSETASASLPFVIDG